MKYWGKISLKLIKYSRLALVKFLNDWKYMKLFGFLGKLIFGNLNPSNIMPF